MSATTRKTVGIFGFTIVELLIVIVVIAILATISIVAYNGIQARANDSKVKSGVVQLEKALRLWALDHPPPILGGSTSVTAVSNGRCSEGVGGWIATGIYVCSVEDALVSSGHLPSGFLYSLPTNRHIVASHSDGRFATMLYQCGANRHSLYWTLRSPSTEETANFDSVRAACGQGADIRDQYGMRAGKILQF